MAAAGAARPSPHRHAAQPPVAGALRRAVGPGVPPWRRWVLVAALLLPVIIVAVACSGRAATPSTATVVRGTVSAKVSGTGALRAIKEENLGFAKGGRLTAVNVHVGQQVTPGQVVARLDDREAQADLRASQAQLRKEVADLDKISDEDKTDASEDDASGAEDVLDATRERAGRMDRANDRAIDETERQVGFARANLREAMEAHEADADRCSKSIGGDSRTKPGEVHQRGGLAGELFIPAPIESAACDRARKSAAAVESARSDVSEAMAARDQAMRRRETDRAEMDVAVESAKRDSRAAKHAARDAKTAKPHDMDRQRAEVDDAQAQVDLAMKAVDDTILRAPVGGRVSAINGAVGEYVGGGSETTPLAPGSRAALPDVTGGVGKSDDSGYKADRPGGSSFMVLDDVNTFQVVVPFAESDASRLQPNQQVDVTFDSLPDVTRRGTVVDISPTGTSIEDVMNYYATIVLNELDPRLKDGQTAQANVIVGEIDNVLVVPNGALQASGATGQVTVLDPDGQTRRVQVQLGMAGDGVTEVRSGLRAGQLVVLADS